ncbi:MAG: hypothetical protein ACYCPW_01025 [Nitrososphaerales archaeon]
MSYERIGGKERKEHAKVEEKIGKEFDKDQETKSKLDEVYRKAGEKVNAVKKKDDKDIHTYMGKKLRNGKDTF